MDTKIHTFEATGRLGKAPYTYIGWFQGKAMPDEYTGSQGCTVCDYCYTSISSCFRIKSSDGKEFIVGSTCVKKTGDAGLIKLIDREVARQKMIADYKKFKKAKEVYQEKEVANVLQSQPHPYLSGKSMYDYIDYVLQHGHCTSQENRIKTAVNKALKSLNHPTL